MTKFLVREFRDAQVTLGKRTAATTVRDVVIEEIDCPSGKLPRVAKGYESIGKYQNGNSYVPWAVTGTGRVVYAQTGGHSGSNDRNFRTNTNLKLRKYDSLLSHERRRLCESELGMIALNNMALTSDAVQKVSKAMRDWLLKLSAEQPQRNIAQNGAATASERFQNAKNLAAQNQKQSVRDVVFSEIGHYLHTLDQKTKRTGMGFGRLSEKSKQQVGPDQLFRDVIQALTKGRLDQIMAIHDAIGRKVLPKFGGPEQIPYDFVGGLVRQPWFDDPARRGRANAPTRATPTTVGGTAPADLGTQMPATAVSRNRGVDMFVRDHGRTREKGADAYYDDVDARHLLFGAGISGTTGTLLQAAIAFSSHLNLEEKKQYVLAIIGYLVGGGMHSYHESMAVAQKVGVPYTPGAFIPSLPQKFLQSTFFRKWHEKYYDIVELGAIHWMYNVTSLPSHMNKQLKCASCHKIQSDCGCRR